MEFNNKFPIDSWSKEENIAVPDENLQKTGFEPEYQPPAHFFNWFWNLVIKSINELQTKLSVAYSELTIAANENFTFLLGKCNDNSNKISELEAKDTELENSIFLNGQVIEENRIHIENNVDNIEYLQTQVTNLQADVENVIPTIASSDIDTTTDYGFYKVTGAGEKYWLFVPTIDTSDVYQMKINSFGETYRRRGMWTDEWDENYTTVINSYVVWGQWEQNDGMYKGSYRGNGEAINSQFANLGYKPKKIEIVPATQENFSTTTLIRDCPYSSVMRSQNEDYGIALSWTDRGVIMTPAGTPEDNTPTVICNVSGIAYHYIIYR